MNFTCLNAMLLAATVAVGAMAAPELALGTTAKPDPLDPDSLAVEACVYLYPLVLMDITRQMTRGVRDLDDVGHRLDLRFRVSVWCCGWHVVGTGDHAGDTLILP